MLGFNAVRLPFRFTDFDLNPLIIQHQCQVAPAVRISATSPPTLMHGPLAQTSHC